MANEMHARSRTAAYAMASYGIVHEDGLWITECAWCKRVRNRADNWQTVAPDVRATMHVELTHGICPECAEACLTRAGFAERSTR